MSIASIFKIAKENGLNTKQKMIMAFAKLVLKMRNFKIKIWREMTFTISCLIAKELVYKKTYNFKTLITVKQDIVKDVMINWLLMNKYWLCKVPIRIQNPLLIAHLKIFCKVEVDLETHLIYLRTLQSFLKSKSIQLLCFQCTWTILETNLNCQSRISLF